MKSYKDKVFQYVKKQYGAEPDYPWGDDSGAVLRHADNKKWFALVMPVPGEKLGLPTADVVDVMNVKLDDPVFMNTLLHQKGYVPAYHMNKQNWISVLLDGSAPLKDIYSVIDMSFAATASKKKQEKNRMHIRRAERRDIKDILSLLGQVDMVHHIIRPDLFMIGTKYTEEELIILIEDDTRPIFVAEEEGNVLGYAFCIFQEHKADHVLTDIKTLYIDDLCVYEHLRGKHVGRALYEHVLRFAAEEGCYNVTLNVWEGNDPARAFYEKMGMAVQKTTMEKVLQSDHD